MTETLAEQILPYTERGLSEVRAKALVVWLSEEDRRHRARGESPPDVDKLLAYLEAAQNMEADA